LRYALSSDDGALSPHSGYVSSGDLFNFLAFLLRILSLEKYTFMDGPSTPDQEKKIVIRKLKIGDTFNSR
jgi:hypothetical protein